MTDAAETTKATVRYVINDKCTRSCSLNPENLPFSDDAVDWFNKRRTLDWMVGESEKMGRKLAPASISRHRARHLDREVPDGVGLDTGDVPVDHLQVLQAMIKQGYKRSSTWRIGPSETLKAMELFYRLTQGSAMEGLFAALTAAAADDDADPEVTHDAGSLSPAEVESAGADTD